MEHAAIKRCPVHDRRRLWTAVSITAFQAAVTATLRAFVPSRTSFAMRGLMLWILSGFRRRHAESGNAPKPLAVMLREFSVIPVAFESGLSPCHEFRDEVDASGEQAGEETV